MTAPTTTSLVHNTKTKPKANPPNENTLPAAITATPAVTHPQAIGTDASKTAKSTTNAAVTTPSPAATATQRSAKNNPNN